MAEGEAASGGGAAVFAPLSSRGVRVARPNPMAAYWLPFGAMQARPWSRDDPDGNIIICVAENKISLDLVHERLLRCTPIPAEAMCYSATMHGTPRLRNALAGMLSRTIMKGILVDPANITVQCGGTSVLNSIFYVLAEPSQAVLIPTPYYPAFDNDLTFYAELVPTPFTLDESIDVTAQLNAAAAASAAAGAPVRVLLLTNPQNPLSTMYKRSTLVDALAWCMRRRVHLVSDEFYGLTAGWGEGSAPFESLEAIARAEAGRLMPDGDALAASLLHVVFGVSKDLCMSGVRVGALHSRCADVNNAMFCTTFFSTASAVAQHLCAELAEDTQWLSSFLAANAARLRAAYGALASALREQRIPFVEADSALFCWVDLREGLRPERGSGGGGATWDDEHALWSQLHERHGVLLVPGRSCHASEPGFFRICWSWVSPEALPDAARRIRACLDLRNVAA